MLAVLLIAGIGFLLAGLLAIGFGIPVKEFSFGNTMILTGAVVGLVNGVVHVRLKVPSFMTTLGTWFVAAGVGNALLGGIAVRINDAMVRAILSQFQCCSTSLRLMGPRCEARNCWYASSSEAGSVASK